MNNLMRKVLTRRSVYTFSANLPKDEDLMVVLEEGKLLSNAETNQIWHFTAIQNKDVIKKIYELSISILPDGTTIKNGAEMLLNMPMLLIISGCNVKYAEDAANSLFGSMMLAAEKHGLSSCWLSGASDVDVNSEEAQKLMHEVKNILQIPGESVPLCIGAFGYKKSKEPARVTKVDSIINIIR